MSGWVRAQKAEAAALKARRVNGRAAGMTGKLDKARADREAAGILPHLDSPDPWELPVMRRCAAGCLQHPVTP